MSEEQTVDTAEVNDAVPMPAALAAEDYEPAHEEAEEAPPPRAKSTRRTKRKVPARKRAAYEEGLVSMEQEYDEWVEKFDWQAPRMSCKVKRESPQHHLGHQTAGTCGEIKANAYYTEEEIRQRFGGGVYRIYVSGIDRDGKFRALGSKKLEMSGAPRTDVPTTEQAQSGLGAQNAPSQENDVANLAPQAQTGLVSMLDKNFERMLSQQQKSGATTTDPEILAQMQRAYEQQAEAHRQAADKEAVVLRAQLNDMRQELSQLRVERDTYQHKVETEVSQARNEGQQYVATMLPTFAQQADQRVQQILHDATERVKTIQEQYARDLQMQQQQMQQQLQNQQALFQATETNAQTLFQGQIAHLQTINATLQAKIEGLESENRQLRDQVLNMHREQATKSDPMSKLKELSTYKELVESFGGGGSDADASPVERMLSMALPTLQSGLDAYTASRGGQPPQQAQMQQQQQQQAQSAPQLQAPAVPLPQGLPQGITPPPGAMVKATPSPRGKRVQAAKVHVRRQDLEVGITLLNAAISSGAAPPRAADAAVGQIDGKTLKALVQHAPAAITASLDRAGLLNGPVASSSGREYLLEFLAALHQRLYPAPAQTTQAQPKPAEEGDDEQAE